MFRTWGSEGNRWISGKYQIADVLTKGGFSEENIRKYVEGRYTEAELEI